MTDQTQTRLEQHQAYLKNQNEMADWGLREFYNMLLRKESLTLRLNLNTSVLDIGKIVDIVYNKSNVTKYVVKSLLCNHLYDTHFKDRDKYFELHEKIEKLVTPSEIFYIPAIVDIILGYFRDRQDVILEGLSKNIETKESIDDKFVKVVKSL